MATSVEGEYWLVSAPGKPSKDAAYKELVAKCGGLANAWQFNVPADLKVGTLDSLVALSDDLVRLDPFVEGVVRKIASMLQELLADHEDKLAESLTAEGQTCDDYVRCVLGAYCTGEAVVCAVGNKHWCVRLG